MEKNSTFMVQWDDMHNAARNVGSIAPGSWAGIGGVDPIQGLTVTIAWDRAGYFRFRIP